MNSLSYVAAALLLVTGPSLCAAAEVASVSLDRSALHELSDSDLKDLLPALSAIAVITKSEANARAYSAAHAEVLERAAKFARAASASAGDRPLQPPATTARDALRALSPVAATALQRLEERRGTPVPAADLRSTLDSEDFQREYRQALSDFCSSPANARVLACVETDRR